MTQWVVRLQDEAISLRMPIGVIAVLSRAEMVEVMDNVLIGRGHARLKRVFNEAPSSQHWICLCYPKEMDAGCAQVTWKDDCLILCGVVNRATADRIVDSLQLSLFNGCGLNTFLDFRELLAADAAMPTAADIANTDEVRRRIIDIDDDMPRSVPHQARQRDISNVPIPTQHVTEVTQYADTASVSGSVWVPTSDDRDRVGQAIRERARRNVGVTDSLGMHTGAIGPIGVAGPVGGGGPVGAEGPVGPPCITTFRHESNRGTANRNGDILAPGSMDMANAVIARRALEGVSYSDEHIARQHGVSVADAVGWRRAVARQISEDRLAGSAGAVAQPTAEYRSAIPAIGRGRHGWDGPATTDDDSADPRPVGQLPPPPLATPDDL